MSSISHYLTNFPFTMISPTRNSARSFIRMQVGECWWKLVFLLSLSPCVSMDLAFSFFLRLQQTNNHCHCHCQMLSVAAGWWRDGSLTHWLVDWLTGWHSFHSFIVSVERRNVGHVFPFKCSFPQQKRKSRKQNMGMSRISYRRHQAGIILA